MSFFRGLDSPSFSEVSSINDRYVDAAYYDDLAVLANLEENKIESRLGLTACARIVLNTIKMAQRAKIHRKECLNIADQAYLLLSAVDGGFKGRAIDNNGILQIHVARLNEALTEIHAIIKRFTSWWIYSRFRAAPRELRRCYDIVTHSMAMYLLLLRHSLSRPAPKSRRSARKRGLPVASSPPALPKHPPMATVSRWKAKAHTSSSAAHQRQIPVYRSAVH